MKTHFKLSGLIAAAVLSVSTFVQAQTTITVASFPSFDEAVKLAKEPFEKQNPDIKIKLVSLSFNDHHNAMTTALATGSGIPDLMGLEIAYIGKFAESKGLEDLNQAPYNGKELATKLHGFGVAQGQDSNGAQIAMPADVSPGTLFYRKDIIDKAGVRPEQLVASWDSFIETGKVIKEKTGANLVAHASELFTVYIRSNLKDGEGLYFDKDGNSLLNTPRFKRAFELSVAARKAGIESDIGTWSNDWREAFKRESLAAQLDGAWLVFHFETWLNPEGKGNWRSIHPPGDSHFSKGGGFFAIPKKAKHKEAAWKFMKFMIDNVEQQRKVFSATGSYPALIEAMEDDEFRNQPVEFLGGQKARVLWHEATAKVPMIPTDKYDQTAAVIIGTALDDVLEDDVDIDKALAAADKKLKRRVRRR